jgi:hypothetical protein
MKNWEDYTDEEIGEMLDPILKEYFKKEEKKLQEELSNVWRYCFRATFGLTSYNPLVYLVTGV